MALFEYLIFIGVVLILALPFLFVWQRLKGDGKAAPKASSIV